jgi:glycerol uptake facilitator-like aquaporin
VSGAHLNPLVTLAIAFQDGMPSGDVYRYLCAQFAGAIVGVGSANVMFGLSPFSFSHHARAGGAQMFSEFVATFGLLMVILVCAAFRQSAIAYAVAGYVTAAYWFTASTSFANPAVAVARALTDTFSGIRPADVPAFIVAQGCGGASAVAFLRWMVRGRRLAPIEPSRTASSRKEMV